MIFAGMSGTAIADAAALGHHRDQGDEGPRLRDRVRGRRHRASATLGPIIPPSLPFVIYAMMANVSVGAVPRRHPARRADGGADDAHGGVLLAHKNGWGGDIKFVWSRLVAH